MSRSSTQRPLGAPRREATPEDLHSDAYHRLYRLGDAMEALATLLSNYLEHDRVGGAIDRTLGNGIVCLIEIHAAEVADLAQQVDLLPVVDRGPR